MNRPLLLFGAGGQVGWELRRSLSLLGEVVAVDQAQVDLQDVQAVRAIIDEVRPTAIINAAAYTAVDRAESEPDQAHAINARAPAVMAEAAKTLEVPLVHYSTDYVYDGQKSGPYVETDATAPLSVYGTTKRAGDEAIMAAGCRYLILRTTWVYAARGHNFIKTILRLAAERDALRIVADQVGTPTSAELIADITAIALRKLLADEHEGGLYHCAATGNTSWHGYARYIVEQATACGMDLKVTPEAIEPIPTSAYPVPAARPANSVLNCQRLENDFHITLPDWQVHVARTIEELTNP